MLDIKICQQARLTRDPRFDGKFFIGVKSTGIFCRTVCPAKLPLEKNVEYFETVSSALQAGFRPCLRCHPDSLPHSYEWSSKDYFLNKIVRLLESGELQEKKLYDLCRDLNITTRYLHKIFVARFGLSPKKYEIYYKCFLAKQLIQQTSLPIGEIAYACGFSSISLFNNTFKQHLNVTPTALRRNKKNAGNQKINLKIAYQPPYDWERFLNFQSQRLVSGLEKIEGRTYSRNFIYKNVKGAFSAELNLNQNYFNVSVRLDDWKVLPAVLVNIHRVLDIDTNLAKIEAVFKEKLPSLHLHSGLRLPGVWDVFEAGVRAICGQQISVAAATTMVGDIIRLAGSKATDGGYYFPTPQQLAELDFSQLKTTSRRKETLKRFADYCCSSTDYVNPDNWLALKGIGEWTVNYAKLRGLGDPDIWIDSDLGIKKALSALASPTGTSAMESLDTGSSTANSLQISSSLISSLPINSAECRPWRSYLALQLWSQPNV